MLDESDSISLSASVSLERSESRLGDDEEEESSSAWADVSSSNRLSNLLVPGVVVDERWEITERLGAGSFGSVFRVVHIESGREAAMKAENKLRRDEKSQVIRLELAIIRRLQGKKHVCRLIGSGETPSFSYVVMSMVGQCLSALRRSLPSYRFSVSTTFRVGLQCLRAIRDIHTMGILHRDIKPSNFAVGLSDGCVENWQTNRDVIYILDFGLSRQYVDEDGRYRQSRSSVGFCGTVRYASINVHRGIEFGRRDDLWSLFYMLIEFLTGELPWRDLFSLGDALHVKERVGPNELLQACPQELHAFYHRLAKLEIDEEPNYDAFGAIFRRILRNRRISDDEQFDWSACRRTTA